MNTYSATERCLILLRRLLRDYDYILNDDILLEIMNVIKKLEEQV